MKKLWVFLLGALLVSTTISAITLRPAQADSAVVGTGTPESCTEAALDAALAEIYPGANAPGGVLSFNCGPNPHTIVLTGQKILQDGTVVDGGGLITLSGGNSTRIFFVAQQARVELYHLSLINGYAEGGGAIFAEPNLSGTLTYLTLVDVTLSSNNSSSFGGAIGALHTGLSLTNSRLTGNTANGRGGAVSLDGGELTLRTTQMSNNTALANGAGGGLDVSSGVLDIQTSVFQANESTLSSGGAVSLQASTGSITSSQFDQNKANALGGGLYLSAASNINLNQLTFTLNSANSGGAISIDNSTLLLDSASLSGNLASNGGGIYNFIGETTIQKTTLTHNQAAYGGGLYSNYRSNLTLLDVTAEANTGTSGGGGFYNGGLAKLTRVTLAQNSGGDGGGIFNSDASAALITNVTISGNKANFGAGVYNNGVLFLTNATIARNESISGGGGLLHNGGNGTWLHMVNTIFTQNTGIAANGDQCLLYKAPDKQLFSLWSGFSCGASTANGNQPNKYAQLGLLAFSGTGLSSELTKTHALLPGSPAIDGGTCANSAPAFDQRGVARPFGAACDMGAVEMAVINHLIYLPVVVR